MKTEINWRGWHTWWSVALALPISIVSLTAIFIAHEDALGLKSAPLPAALRPAVQERTAAVPEIRAAHRHGDGTLYIAMKNGLFAQTGTTLTPVPALAGIEVRGLASTMDGLYAATKSGVWRLAGENWERVLRGEAWSVNAASDRRIVAAMKQGGVVASNDGGATWQAERALNQALTEAVAAETHSPRFTLHKLVMDMHTGKAFLGKTYEWLWIDIVAGAMLFLSFSGLVMWWRARRQRRRMILASQAEPARARA